MTAADSGRSVNLRTGDLLSVTLLGKDAPGGRWPQLTLEGDSLRPLPNPAQAATLGTQLGEFCAVKPGPATLTSGPWQARVAVTS